MLLRLRRLWFARDAMLLFPRRPLKQLLFSHSVSRQFDQLHQLSENRQCNHSVSKYHNQFRTSQNFSRLSLLRIHTVAGMASSASTPSHSNRLANERSPYLLQHAHNPVDWYPWGPEAFARAEAENKPIFLSIGYSTCHWCHVMERESFENDEVADILRENFVAIKLDREEHPDIDKIYMSYVQKITGNGGWPLSLFLTPTLEPIYGGTYFPLHDNFGKIGFKSLLELIARQWGTQHNTLKREAKFSIDLVQAQVYTKLSARNRDLPGEVCWKKCFVQMNRSYDPIHGGFTESPKFPQPSLLSFLMHMYKLRSTTYEGQKALDMALLTLRRIGHGGIHDHVGSGFARYSVDGRWQVPHFEKMLYDQSQLALVYIDAYLISKEPFFYDMTEDILSYVSRDLSHIEGGFYGAEDADSFETHGASAKTEGAFYVWTIDELRAVITDPVEFDIFCAHFDVKEAGNVDPKIDLHNELANKNVLCSFGTYESTAAEFERSVEDIKQILQKCLNLLRVERAKRPRPAKDTKIVTAWNGLMIAAYAKAGFAFKNDAYTERAILAADFIRDRLAADDGSLLRCCYGDGDDIQQVENPIIGLLEDYAFLIRGLLYLYQATLNGAWLEWAEHLQEIQNEKFWDTEYGSYFQSHGDDPYTVLRDKEEQDGAEPCGNSVAAHNLIRLDQYLDRKDFREQASQILRGYSAHLKELPITLPEMISALMLFHSSSHQIFIAGKRDAQNTQALIDVVRGEYLPGHLLVLADGPTGKSSVLYQRNLALESIHPVRGKAAAYVCKEFACTLPVTSPNELYKSLTRTHSLRGDGTSSDSD